MHLRRHRPEEINRGPCGGEPQEARRHVLYLRCRRLCKRPRHPPVHRRLCRLQHRRILPGPRPGRLDHLRRPLQAGRGLPPDLPASAASAGTGGLPRRHLLQPLPAPGAGLPGKQGTRRRIADGASYHRNAGRRRLRLHPDERHLDHRRPGLPGALPLLLGHPPGNQRGA
jgi:hypothetical protein